MAAVAFAVTGTIAIGSGVTAAATSSSGDALTAAIVVSGLSVLSLIVGGFITYITNRRTGGSPPSGEDELNPGRRISAVEQNYANLRDDVEHNSDRLDDIDRRVGPLAEQVKVRFEEVYRRLIDLEQERRDRK